MFNEHSESDLPQVKIKRPLSKPDAEGRTSLPLAQGTVIMTAMFLLFFQFYLPYPGIIVPDTKLPNW